MEINEAKNKIYVDLVRFWWKPTDVGGELSYYKKSKFEENLLHTSMQIG